MSELNLQAREVPTLSSVLDKYGLFAIASVMSLAFLIFDLILPLGIAGGVPHVAVMLLGLWFPSRKQIVAISLFSILMVILGYFLSPEGGEIFQVLFNRGLALFVIITTGTVIYHSTTFEENAGVISIKYKPVTFTIAIILLPFFLTLDVFLPLGVAGGVPYVAAVSLGLWFPFLRQVITVTMLSVLLTLIGYVVSPEGEELWKVLFNRSLALFVIISTGAVIYYSRKNLDERNASTKAFDREINSYENVSSIGYRGLVAVFPVLLLTVGVSYWSDQRRTKSVERVLHSHQVQISLSNVLSQLKDAETGQRGFLLTGNEAYLEPYNIAISQLDDTLAKLKNLTADNPNEQKRLKKIEVLKRKKLEELGQTIRLLREEGQKSAIDLVATDLGKDIMDQIRSIIADMNAEEQRLLEIRIKTAEKESVLSQAIEIIGVILLILIGTIVVFRARSLLASRQVAENLLLVAKDETEQANKELQKLTEDLEERIDERTRDLKESENILSHAQQIAHLGSWTWNIKTGDNRWSDEQYRILGLSPEDEKPSFDLLRSVLHPDDVDGVLQVVQDALDGTQPYDSEYRIIRPDGEIRYIDAQGQIICDAHGEPEKMYGTIFDITEKKAAEANLRQTQKMESLGNLSGGIAHDINNMLVPIQNITDMTIRELPEDSSIRKDLGMVLTASEKIKDLVDKILSFSRQESTHMKELDILKETSTAVELLKSTIPASITLKYNFIPDLGFVAADRTQYSSILINLASNALDAMEGKTGELEISLTSYKGNGLIELENKNYALLTVTDTGVGIDPDVIHRIYDPFFTTKEVGAGTGMGLSMIYGIVTNHGGAMDITSEPDEGTTVSVYLPLV